MTESARIVQVRVRVKPGSRKGPLVVADSGSIGPGGTNPANTDPANTGPANTGPANTNPASTAPANTDPANAAPANTDSVTVYLQQRPVDGAANDALVRVLATYFGVPRSAVSILRGHHSRMKQVRVLQRPS